MGKNQEQNRKMKVKELANTLRREGRGGIPSDVTGSYTGTPSKGERPEQDADDL
jgi:hypothetical protein